MSATVFSIVEKVKEHEVVSAKLDNFILREGESLSAERIVQNPNISLYCLDDARRQAIFVETTPGIDLTQAPFYYQAQYTHAVRLIAVPYETFHQLADAVGDCDLILIYSTGRCGSTLISQALSTVEGVLSLSEPDVYTQIHEMRYADPSRDDEYRRLLQSSTRMFGKDTPTLALKFRGMCILVGDLLYQAFPQAKNLFLYRNAETWARSMGLEFAPPEARRIPTADLPLHWRAMTPLAPAFTARVGHEPSRNELMALAWLSIMDKYLALREMGMAFLALRYEDIQTEPKPILAAVFDTCGLKDADVEQAYAVFAKDSQAGTTLSQASRKERPTYPFEAEDLDQMRGVLQAHSLIRSADVIVPETWSSAQE